MSEVIDWSQLEMIGDDFSADFAEIYREFLVGIPVLLGNLREAIALGDCAQTARVAHQLKGSAANFGFIGVSVPMEELERVAKGGSLDGADAALMAADSGYRAAAEEVRVKKCIA